MLVRFLHFICQQRYGDIALAVRERPLRPSVLADTEFVTSTFTRCHPRRYG